MKGKTKLGLTFVLLAVAAVSLLVFTAPIQADPSDQSTTTLEDGSKTYSTCGGIEGCRASCGCGCRGNPEACGCGL
jgi:hypothetical protein